MDRLGKLFFILTLGIVGLWLSAGPVHAADTVYDVHVVEPGETLSEIAVAYDTDVETLRRLNDLGDIDLVWVGLPLTLPPGAAQNVVEAEAVVVNARDASYTVQAGDTLSSIAVAHGLSLAQLIDFNRISPSQRLVAGKTLALRPAASEPQPEPTQPNDAQPDLTEPTESEPARVHVVQPGEHLGSIAALYTTGARKIAELNSLSNASLVVPGQELRIPPPSFDELATTAPIGDDGYHYHPAPLDETEKWIDVDLSEQRVVAYEGATPVAEFVVSTGKQATPTVVGAFRIWAKTPVQDMYGGNRAADDYYYLEDVQWVQYFYEDYGFHGADWHDSFGQPMSRGCVNMRNEDAEWLYAWAGPNDALSDENGWVIIDSANPGTLVVVHE